MLPFSPSLCSFRLRARSARLWALALLSAPLLSGCAVIAVADVAASIAVGTAGLAVDAAVGTAKIAGKAVGKTADLVLGSDPED
jgi:hypothetical protein